MAKPSRSSSVSADRLVSAERRLRLFRLLQILAKGPATVALLRKRLRLDVRSFYRELELLRMAGVQVEVVNGRYVLEESYAKSLDCLPIPDPQLTFGEARTLAKGRLPVHRRIKDQLKSIKP